MPATEHLESSGSSDVLASNTVPENARRVAYSQAASPQLKNLHWTR